MRLIPNKCLYDLSDNSEGLAIIDEPGPPNSGLSIERGPPLELEKRVLSRKSSLQTAGLSD